MRQKSAVFVQLGLGKIRVQGRPRGKMSKPKNAVWSRTDGSGEGGCSSVCFKCSVQTSRCKLAGLAGGKDNFVLYIYFQREPATV